MSSLSNPRDGRCRTSAASLDQSPCRSMCCVYRMQEIASAQVLRWRLGSRCLNSWTMPSNSGPEAESGTCSMRAARVQCSRQHRRRSLPLIHNETMPRTNRCASRLPVSEQRIKIDSADARYLQQHISRSCWLPFSTIHSVHVDRSHPRRQAFPRLSSKFFPTTLSSTVSKHTFPSLTCRL